MCLDRGGGDCDNRLISYCKLASAGVAYAWCCQAYLYRGTFGVVQFCKMSPNRASVTQLVTWPDKDNHFCVLAFTGNAGGHARGAAVHPLKEKEITKCTHAMHKRSSLEFAFMEQKLDPVGRVQTPRALPPVDVGCPSLSLPEATNLI